MREPRPKTKAPLPYKAPGPPPCIRQFPHAHYLRQLDWLSEPDNGWLIHVFRCRQRERYRTVPGWSCTTTAPLIYGGDAYRGPLLPVRHFFTEISVTGAPTPPQLIPLGSSWDIWDRLMTNPIYQMAINFITVELNLRNNCHRELLQYFRNQTNPRAGGLGKCPTPFKPRSPWRQLSNSPQLRDWCQWAHFCSVRDYSLWIQATNPVANVSIFEFAVWLGDFCFFSRLHIKQALESVEYFHSMAGFPRFRVTCTPTQGKLSELLLFFNKSHRAGGPAQQLDLLLTKVLSSDKLRALMAGMRSGTSKRYISSWRQWARFCEIRGIEPWLVANRPGWGESLLDYILWLHELLSISARTIASEISGVRYFHFLAGYREFSATGSRFRILLKSLAAGIPPMGKLPFNIDLLSWLYLHYYSDNPTAEIKSTWCAIILSFFFLLRTSECRNLLVQDVTVSGPSADKPYGHIRIFIRSSKTDRFNQGFSLSRWGQFAVVPLPVFERYGGR